MRLLFFAAGLRDAVKIRYMQIIKNEKRNSFEV